MDRALVFGTSDVGSIPAGGMLLYFVGGLARRSFSEGGYGLVVEHILAKDETGVRFSLPAPKLGINL